jgi:CubicO group peptidase (beta-lactamase class C family)
MTWMIVVRTVTGMNKPLTITLCAAGAIALVACSSSPTSSDSTTPPTSLRPTPSVTQPETSSPDTSVPDTNVLDTGAPDAGVPGTDAAGSIAPDEAAVEQTRAFMSAVEPADPGCTIAVARDGAVVFAEAYGAAKLEPLTPMTTDTVVDIGSTSKQFTATSILLLADRGRIDLDAPIATYMSDLPPWADQITVDQLVHHQSGIPDYIGLLLAEGKAFTDVTTDADALTALAKATDLEFAPGSQFSYSNSNYFLLAQIVLSVTGDDLGAFLATEVFEPLQLDAVMDPTAQIPAKATSYSPNGDGWLVADSPWQQLGDGGIQTTPTQLVKWASEYWAPTIGPDDINSQRLADAVDEGSGIGSYGFGITETTVDGEPVLSHSGGWGGFVTTFVVDPARKLAVAGTCTATPTWADPSEPDIGASIMRFWLS